VFLIFANAKLDSNSLEENATVKPLGMDVEWLLQGNTIGFTGFFCEFLGLTSGLNRIFPDLRVGKSSFIQTLNEPHFGGKEPTLNAIKTLFDEQLFPEESKNLLELSYPSQTKNFAKDSSGDSSSSISERQKCLNTSSLVEHGVTYLGGGLAKHYVPSAYKSAEDCCQACAAHPLCVGWSFGPEFIGTFVSTIGPASEKLVKCSLKGTFPKDDDKPKYAINGAKFVSNRPNPIVKKLTPEITSGIMQPFKRVPPRALIFHGTMCLYRNESVHTLGRDINTIYIGRYMVERSNFPGGFSQDEYLVFSCSARMDEIWVPTEWHKKVFMNTMQSMGIQGSDRVVVIPEAVDANLFDPEKVRTKEEGNLFERRSRQPEDGCRILENNSNSVVCTENNNKPKKEKEFRFLSTFKWERRKGWDILLDAYWSTFTKSDDVILVLRTYVPSFSYEHTNITAHIEKYALDKFNKSPSELARVVWEKGEDQSLLSDSLTRADMRDLLASVDCFVLPTRGEGWGLPIAEAMSMQLPVIVTNATGPQAFANDENAYLLPVLEQLDDMSFVQPDVTALKSILREVIKDAGPDGTGKAQRKALKAREKMKEISPEYVSGLMAERLRIESSRRGFNL
jgi:glycosyltransferase involved in cell wall biosynthesis